jgi:glycosyltransferase involved in cell wall biosynthesis/radical SAM superfamily enzyme YgiQ (UPF0313 family)
MTYLVVLLATRWGSELGGLNVFNTGLASAMPSVLTKHSRTMCFVEDLPTSGTVTPEGVELLPLEKDPENLAEQLWNVCQGLKPRSLHGVLVIGHDVITGALAIDCVTHLNVRLGNDVTAASAVISHMDYWEYSRKKGKTLGEVTRMRQTQKDVVLEADYAYAVGPLLTANFSSARGVKRGRSSPVRRLIPGVADIRVNPLDSRNSLQFFISGRLNPEDDPIKNGVLAIHALVHAYKERRAQFDQKWIERGRLIAYGVDVTTNSKHIGDLQRLASEDARFEIEPVPFSRDQVAMHDHLANCHVALMPSWHEGFGLSGWEALCAGVPLLCSQQSGLAQFLQELKASRPDLPLDSVEFFNLSGTGDPGSHSERDIELFSDAVVRIVSDLARRKQSAMKLARVLKAEFTWKRCASDLLDSIKGWYLPGSVHWSARQRFASDEVNRPQTPEQQAEVLERVNERLGALKIIDDWQDLTTAFNYLSDLGESAKRIKRREYFHQLEEIGRAMSPLLAASDELPPLRDTGLLDVCWRYMAACSAIADDFSDFANLFPQPLISTIWSDSFLARELLHYAKRFADEFDQGALDLAKSFFEPLHQAVSLYPTIAPRIARLASTRPAFFKLANGIEDNESYQLEAHRCKSATHSAHDVAVEVAKDPSLVATVLAQMAFGTDLARQVADQARAFIKAYYPNTDKVEGHWRGDKRLNAALTTANLPTTAVLPALQRMANDEDESIRWAALHLAFSPILRSRLEASSRAKTLGSEEALNKALGRIVDDAVKFDAGHPWLCREFLLHFQREWQPGSPQHSPSQPEKFTLFDFPVSRWLFGPVIGERSPDLHGARHPEVRYVREAAQESVRRVLLVLPPIESLQANAVGASGTSTPPLGLGLLATHLAAQGHDVQIADCHRFPELSQEVIRLSLTFDLIGFNTVFTTVRTTMEMLTEIRSHSARAILVVGGPVAKLGAWKQAAGTTGDASTSWDFAISDHAEDNLTLLARSLKLDSPWPDTQGMQANRESLALKHRDLDDSFATPAHRSAAPLREWKNIFVDRRVFRSNGIQYEPSRTRSRTLNVHQAHVVMSQGCDWDCVFCTERSSVSGGERRRIVESVLEEVLLLTQEHKHLNIQFIDDNLLPQIAALAPTDTISRVRSTSWATSFLRGLEESRLRSAGSFGWRGIFRLEDFFAYEDALGQSEFLGLLSRSGCQMLAFGIEQGDEERRMKTKKGKASIPNTQIANLFKRLRQADILTKAYFILGGQWESQESATATVDFAIESGVSLAYFALYKDFTGAARTLRRPRIKGDMSGQEFLNYRQLAMDWDAEFSDKEAHGHGAPRTSSLFVPATADDRACYRQLAALGFSFFDVVKYNDFHNDTGPSEALLKAVTWSSPSAYFASVEQAYRRFYLRPSFVEDYRLLLAHGY